MAAQGSAINVSAFHDMGSHLTMSCPLATVLAKST